MGRQQESFLRAFKEEIRKKKKEAREVTLAHHHHYHRALRRVREQNGRRAV
jgi:hypothetical protein